MEVNRDYPRKWPVFDPVMFSSWFLYFLRCIIHACGLSRNNRIMQPAAIMGHGNHSKMRAHGRLCSFDCSLSFCGKYSVLCRGRQAGTITLDKFIHYSHITSINARKILWEGKTIIQLAEEQMKVTISSLFG